MGHSKEEGYDKRTRNSKGVRDHTEQVSKKNRKEKVKQDNEVLLFADIKILLYNRLDELVKYAKSKVVVISQLSAKACKSASHDNDIER